MSTLSIFNPLFDLFDEALISDYPTAKNNRFPPVDIIETKDNYTLEMELSGLSENDIELSIKERILSIGTKSSENKSEIKANPVEEKTVANGDKSEEKRYLLRERKNYSFNRKFTLSQDADVENVSAKFTNGLLTICIPKKPEAELKHIQINVA